MKKTIFAICFSALMLLLLVACGNGYEPYTPDEPEEEQVQFVRPTPRPTPVTPEVVEEDEEVEEEEEYEEYEEEYVLEVPDDRPERGVWDGSVYENEFLGFRFIMPSGWESFSDDELADAVGLGMNFMDVDAVDAVDVFPEMMAINLATGDNVSIMFERVDENTDLEQAFQMTIAGVMFGGIEVTEIPGTERIGDFEYSSFGTFFELAGITVIGQQFVTLVDDLLVIINISSLSPDTSLDGFLDMFSDLSEDIPDIPDTPDTPVGDFAEELIGTWDWFDDDSFTMIFEADGTGARNWTGSMVDFTWSADGDHLTIDTWESWTFSVTADVLIIESNQVAGMIYIYNRR